MSKQGGEFSGFSFYLIYPRLGAEEFGSLEMPTGADKQKATTKVSL